MSRKALLDRYNEFVAGATLGAHANSLGQGFRQNDVRFILEIFTNWVASAEGQTSLPVQNTQIARYLDALAEEGFARKTAKQNKPFYKVTRAGLIELITRLVSGEHYNPREYFYFVYYMVTSYRSRIIELVRREGSRFPYSMQLELESLLSPETLLERQLAYTRRTLAGLEKRIRDSKSIETIIADLQKDGKDFKEIVNYIDRRHPFGLSGERRYSEVLQAGTERQRLWEMTVGNAKRMELIMKPSCNLLRAHLHELEELKKLLMSNVGRTS